MELKARRVNLAGCNTNPNEAWVKMIALELTNCGDRFLQQKKYLIMGHDATREREACKTACAKPKPECTPAAIFRMAETRMPSLPDSFWRDRNQDASLQPREGLLGNVH